MQINLCQQSRRLTTSSVILSVTNQHQHFSSQKLILSSESRDRCVGRLKKMKSLRPSDVPVTQRAAVLVPLVDISDTPHLLFTRRSLSLSSHSGQVSFPGGKQDPDDVDLVRTALRETEEELGISSSDIDVWCQMPELSSSRKGDYSATPVVGVIKNYSSKSLKPSIGEVSSVFTVPLSVLAETSNHGYTQFSYGYSLPVFHRNVPYVIWGLTAIITFQFMRALLPTSTYSHKIIYQKPIQ